MKTRGLLLTIILLAGISRIAYSQNNCNQPPCENGTNTNPNPIYTRPQTGDFRQNTFDWRAVNMPVNKDNFSITQYLNPFNSYHPYLFGLGFDKLNIGKDNRPEDGWELIKQDFGYAFNNGQWNGIRMPVIENGDVVFEQSIINYFVLYNKYTGVLRVFGSHPNQGNDYSGIIVHIEIIHKDLENFKNQFNYEDYKANGLFALNSPVSTALDKKTKNLVVTTLAISPPTQTQFFYADFQMSYDPCICLFEGGLRFSFETLREADITMAGKAIGANVDVAKLTPNGGSLNFVALGFNPQAAIGQINTNGNDREAQLQSIMQHYADLEKLISKMESAGATSSEIDAIKKGLKLLGTIATGGKLLALKFAVETMSKFIDFGTYDETKNKTKFKSSVVTSYLELVGKVVTRVFQNGAEFYIATPGSCGAESRDEYMKHNNSGVIPMYPMYNERLGLFALMTSPKILRNKKNDNPDPNFEFKDDQISNKEFCIINNNGIDETHVFFPSLIKSIINNDRATYKIQDLGFDFVFNPIIDSEKSFIDASIEVYDIGDVISFCQGNETQNKFGINCNELDQKNGISRYRTEFVPLECVSELVFQTGHTFEGDGGRYAPRLTEARSKAFIIFNIYYVFKEDAYGKVHTTVQTIKYPLELVETSTDLEQDPNFIALQNIPTDLVINTTTFTNPERIFSKGTITIDGDLINNSPDNITNPNQPTTELSNTNLQVQPNNLGLILHANAINNPFSRWDNTTNRFTPNNNSNYSMTADITFSIKNTNTWAGVQNVQGLILEILNNNNAVLSSTNITYASPFFLGADNGSIPPNHITSSESLSVSINLNGVLTTNESVYFRVKPLVGNQAMTGAISFATNQLRIEVSNFSAKIAEGSLTKKPVVILAENQINFVSGSVGSSIELSLGSVSEFICSDKTKIKPMSSGELLSYCNSENYKAKEVAPAAYGLPVSQNISQHQNKSLLRNTPKIQPNPNNGSFKINYQSDLTLDANLILLDIAGREVYRDLLKQGESSYSIHDLHLTPGVYFVTISSQIEKQTIKIIIQN